MLYRSWMIWCGFALLKLILHLVSWYGYGDGYFRDEFYFIDCGKHLDWGYVDHAPMVGWVAALSNLFFGESLLGLRIFPFLSGALKIFLVGWLTKELGGGLFAQALACLCFLMAPVFMASDSMLTIITFEQLFWLICCALIIRLINQNTLDLWVALGIFIGLGLLTKHSFIFFIIATLLALLLSPYRSMLWSKGFGLATAIAFILFLPNILWQIAYDWPTLSFLRNLNQYTHSHISTIEFLIGQFLYHHPITTLISISGIFILFYSQSLKKFRFIALMFIFSQIILIFLKAKVYYISPMYPIALAVGSVWFEQVTHPVWIGVRWFLIGIILVSGMLLAPIFMPILPYEHYQTYASSFVKTFPNLHELKQLFADRFGWKNQVKTIADVYHQLSPEEQKQCMILVSNYGKAGAINLYGKEYHLPPAYCGDMTYYYWGPGNNDYQIVIVNGFDRESLEESFETVEEVALIVEKRAMPIENNVPIYLCRKPFISIQEKWPDVKKGF